jgi:hypothetical protein
MKVGVIKECYVEVLDRGVNTGQKTLQVLAITMELKVLERAKFNASWQRLGKFIRDGKSWGKEMEMEHLETGHCGQVSNQNFWWDVSRRWYRFELKRNEVLS